MAQVIVVLIPIALLVFWGWMLSDMMKNDSLPACFMSITRGSDPRLDWTAAFLLLNIFAAFYYYVNEYRYKH